MTRRTLPWSRHITSSRPRRPAAWLLGLAAPLALTLFTLWRFREAALLRVAFARGDIGSEFAPFRIAAAETLRAGGLLLWSPQILGGYPAAANPHAGVFYPPNWLLALLVPPWGSVSYYTILHVLVAALGMYWLLRDLEMRRLAALLGSLVFAFNGNRVFENYVYIGAVAYLPLLVFAWRRAIGTGEIRYFCWAALGTAGAWLGSSPQMSYVVTLAGAALAAAQLALGDEGVPRAPRPWRKVAVGAVVYGLLATALAAVQILPTAELTLHTPRVSPVWEVMTEGSLEPQSLPGIFTERKILYLGAAPLALAIAGAFCRRRTARSFALVGCMFLLLTLGKYTPFYRAVYYTVPGIAAFRIPLRFYVGVTFCAAVLAALALDALQRWRPRLPWAGSAAAGLLTAIVALDYLALPRRQYFDPATPPRLADQRRGADTLAFLESHADGVRVLPEVARTTIWGSFPDKLRDLQASTPLLTRLESADGYVPLHYIPYMRVFGNLQSWSGTAKERLLDFLNIGFIVRDGPSAPGEDVIWRGRDGLRVVRNADVLPRAVLVREAFVDADVQAVLGRLASGEWRPAERAQLFADERLDLRCDQTFRGTARVTSRQPQRIAVAIDSTCPVVLWLLETDYPGWRARIDGAPARLFPVNLMYRGMAVPAGRHTVVVRYVPTSVGVGAVLSLCGLTAAVTGIAWSRGRATATR